MDMTDSLGREAVRAAGNPADWQNVPGNWTSDGAHEEGEMSRREGYLGDLEAGLGLG